MTGRKLLLYAIFAFLVLVLLRVVAAFVLGVFNLIVTILTLGVIVLVLGAILSGAVRLLSSFQDDEPSSSHEASTRADTFDSPESESVDRIEELKMRYAEGEFSEDELEHRLERELDEPELDPIDRELRRERE